MGDFNEVRSSSERMGSVFDQNGALKFNEFIKNTVLMDLPLCHKRFTRINKHGSKLSKLDRIMVSGYFVDKLPQANLNALTILLKIKLQGVKACLKNWRQTVRLAESASAVTLRARLDQLDLLAEL
ncbi:cytochrome P450, partial [Tanacetum coccineum]